MASEQSAPRPPRVLALAAHPDDIEFYMSGTLILLQQAGWEAHYMNIANGCCGSAVDEADVVAAKRRDEARAACALIGAHWHESIVDDLQVYHARENVAKVLAVVRRVAPSIILLQSPADYMTDHEEASRIGVTAAFCRGMRNAPCDPPEPPVFTDVTLYHAMPHSLRDPLRRKVRAGQYVNVASVLALKREMLAKHVSQKEWLDTTQGFDSYLDTMEHFMREIGTLSGRFEYAEGWRRHLHVGFSAKEADPLTEALGQRCFVDQAYEAALDNG